MQKQDYILLANCLRCEGYEANSKITQTIALALFADNPRFDRMKFLQYVNKEMTNDEIDAFIDDLSMRPHVAEDRKRQFDKLMGK